MKNFTLSLLVLLSINISSYGIFWLQDNNFLVDGGYVLPTTTPRTVNTSVTTGDNSTVPFGVAINPKESFAYVTRQGTSGVSVIDLTNLDISNTLFTPSESPTGVGHNPTLPKLYVTLATSAEVRVFDTSSSTLIGIIGVGTEPTGVAFSPDGSRAYITNTVSNTISVIDDASLTVVGTITGLLNPLGIVISPDGTRAYVANSGADEVAIVDLTTNTLLTPIPTGANPKAVALSNNGNILYVANSVSENVQVFNPSTRQELSGSPIALTAIPQNIVLSKDNTRAFVTLDLDQSGRVALINTETNQVEKELPVGTNPEGIGFAENGLLVVANKGSGNVSIFFSQTDAEVVQVGAEPSDSVASIDGRVFVANKGSDTISVYDAKSKEIIATISLPAGSEPSSLALSRNSNQLFVANNGNGSVTEIETRFYHVVKTYTFPGVTTGPNSISCINDDDGFCSAFLLTALNQSSMLTQVDTFSGETTELTLNGMGISISVAPSPNQSGQILYTVVDDSNTVTSGQASPNVSISSSSSTTLDFSVMPTATFQGIPSSTFAVISSSLSTSVPQPNITPPLDLSRFAFVADAGNNVVIVVDIDNSQILTTIQVGEGPSSLAISADGNFLYVTNSVSKTISVIDLTTFQVVNTVATGLNPLGVSAYPILPLNAEGSPRKDQFFTQTDYFNQIEWSPPLVAGIVDEYLIFTDQDLTDLIGSVSESVFTFEDHSILKPTTQTYYIIGIQEGFATSSSTVTVGAN